MSIFLFSNRRLRSAVSAAFSLAVLICLTGGCASLKCGQKDSTPTPPPSPAASCPSDSNSGDCGGTCPAPSASHSGTSVSVTGSGPAPGGSVVSGEEIPQTVSQDVVPPAPPITSDPTTSRYLNGRQEEIIRDPNGIMNSVASPAGYQETVPAPPLSGETTQSAQYNGQFQNASLGSQPSRSRIQFRTVIEE